jgi:hypothetical protein
MRYLREFESYHPYQSVVCVDIQREYLKGIERGFNLGDWVDWINRSEVPVYFVWNGPEVGGPEESEYQEWLEEIGVNPDVIENSEFIEKEYGFFRICLDYGWEADVLRILRYLIDKKLHTTQDMREEDWDELEAEGKMGSREYFERGEVFYVPEELIRSLKWIDEPILICGGGKKECLREVELVLDYLNKKWERSEDWTY